VQGRKDSILIPKSIKKTPYFFRAKEVNQIKDSSVTVYFPKNTFYEDLYFDFTYNNGIAKLHNSSVPVHSSFKLSFDVSSYTEDEISHLEDVKKLMHFANNYFVFILVIEIFLLVVIYQIDRKQFYKPFLYGGIISTAVLLLTLFWALMDFSSLFNLFHQIFFPQGNWQFPETGKLVNLFTASFFYQITKEIFIKSLMSSIIFIGLGLYLKKKF